MTSHLRRRRPRSQPKMPVQIPGWTRQGPQLDTPLPHAGPVLPIMRPMLAAPMGSFTMPALGFQPAALTLTQIKQPDAETPPSVDASSSGQVVTPAAKRQVELSGSELGRPAPACKDEDTSDSTSSDMVPEHVYARVARVPPPPPPPRRKRTSCTSSERTTQRKKMPSVSVGGASSSSNSLAAPAGVVGASATGSDGSATSVRPELREASDSSSSEADSSYADQRRGNLEELRRKLLAAFARRQAGAQIALTAARASHVWRQYRHCSLQLSLSCLGISGSKVMRLKTPAAEGRVCRRGLINVSTALQLNCGRSEARSFKLQADIDFSRRVFLQQQYDALVALSGACCIPRSNFRQCPWKKRQAAFLMPTHCEYSGVRPREAPGDL